MPSKNTPPKHMTPNYRLKVHRVYGLELQVIGTFGEWLPKPLRKTRKDLPQRRFESRRSHHLTSTLMS